MALLLLVGHGRSEFSEANAVAEDRQVDCVFHFLEVFDVEDVTLRVKPRRNGVGHAGICEFVHRRFLNFNENY